MNRKQRRQAASGRRSQAGEARGLVHAAVEHHRAGRLDKAAALYRRALKQRPEDAEALHLLGVLLHQQGKHDQALDCLEKAVRLDDRAAAYHFNYGEVLRALDRNEEASRRYRQALALEPANADAHFALGTALLELGDPGAAVQSIRRALELRPGDVEAWLNLGAALLDDGDNEGAIEAFRRALKLAPAFPEAHVNLGGALREKGDLEAAIASFERAIEVAPGLADAHFGLGVALAERSDHQGAAAAYRKAAACDPSHARAHLNLGKTLEDQGRLEEAGAALRDAVAAAPDDPIVRLALGNLAQRRGELDEAIACFEAAAELDPGFAVAFLNLGNAWLDKGRPEAAIESYRQALAIEPDNAQGHFNLGVALQSQGAFEAAIEALERALDLKPDFAEAVAGIAVSKSYREGDPEIARIEELLADDDLPAASRINLGFTLGKIHDDLGRYDEAFARFRAANALKDAELGFDGAANAAFLTRIRDTFDGDFLAARRGWGTPSELPVLVLGMPRSGTTLVEQILASHPEVFGAGELRKLRHIVDGLPSRLGTDSRHPARYPECAALIDAAGAEALGQEYLEALREHSAEAARITDKMPQNFLRLGLVALILPAARIIHCRRDPLDTCLSCYFQHFGSPYEFAYDLESLGTYYRHYEALMAHWAEVLPNAATHPMLELQYEDLIADQEGVSREIVAFCGLEWDQRCLAFHESRRPVRTASQWQVRQPLYASSVGRWRHYEKHLAPLKAALGANSP